MTLEHLLETLEYTNDNFTLYASAKPEWAASSEAVACMEPPDGSIPPEARGMKYLLEVWLAKQVIEVWREWRNGTSPTVQEAIEAIVYYAEHDSYLPASPQKGA